MTKLSLDSFYLFFFIILHHSLYFAVVFFLHRHLSRIKFKLLHLDLRLILNMKIKISGFTTVSIVCRLEATDDAHYFMIRFAFFSRRLD